MSYGQIRRKSSAAAKARLMSDSCSWHSDSSEGDRSAQIGSPMPRIPASGPGVVGNERLQAGMILPGSPAHFHVDPVNIRRATAERGAQELELARADHHEDRLAALEAAMNERQGAVNELMIALVKNGFVMKGAELVKRRSPRLVIPRWRRKLAALGQICLLRPRRRCNNARPTR